MVYGVRWLGEKVAWQTISFPIDRVCWPDWKREDPWGFFENRRHVTEWHVGAAARVRHIAQPMVEEDDERFLSGR